METHDRELGPIDIVVIAYPAGAPMTGEAVPLLMDLVERGIIRVLDAMFVMKNEDGTFSGFDARDLDEKGVGDFTVFEGASSGLLGEEDVATAADALEPGSAAVMIVYENSWAGPFIASTPSTPPRRRRPDREERAMPGLLRGMARTAVVAGTATAVSNRVSRRQANRWAQQEAEAYEPMPSAAPVAAAPDPIEQLKELAELHQQGILTDEEFAAQKAKLLG
jgi:Family of unknown function (DUF6325)/Short C-terminal domain